MSIDIFLALVAVLTLGTDREIPLFVLGERDGSEEWREDKQDFCLKSCVGQQTDFELCSKFYW